MINKPTIALFTRKGFKMLDFFSFVHDFVWAYFWGLVNGSYESI